MLPRVGLWHEEILPFLTIQTTNVRENVSIHQEETPFQYEFKVDSNSIDQNGHVNNVVYVQWMQDVAIRHADACGGSALTHKLGCSWIVRSHTIDYLRPAFAGDRIVATTWVANFQKVRSLRKYAFQCPEWTPDHHP